MPSEDLDFDQIKAGDIGYILTELRKVIKQIITGNPKYKSSASNNTLIYTYYAENPPNPKMKIKIEINTREHFAIEGIKKLNFECSSDWFTGSAEIITYSAEELLATKLRALYQRKKGRDLFDLWISRELKPDFEKTVKIFKAYLDNENLSITKKEYLDNLISKIEDPLFQNDILPLIRNSSEYNVKKAFDFVKNKYITHI